MGGDSFGELVLRQLRAEGVDTTDASTDGTRPTGLMFVEQRTADLTRVEYRRTGSAGSAIAIEDVRPALERGARVLHLTGITPALSESARSAVAWAAETASAAGPSSPGCQLPQSAVVAPAGPGRGAALAAHASLVIASDDELELVADGPERDAVTALLGQGVQQVAVKRGHLGASVHSAAGRSDVPAVPVTSIDPIGAGDAFTAGFLSGTLDGLEPADCWRVARVRRLCGLHPWRLGGRPDPRLRSCVTTPPCADRAPH